MLKMNIVAFYLHIVDLCIICIFNLLFHKSEFLLSISLDTVLCVFSTEPQQCFVVANCITKSVYSCILLGEFWGLIGIDVSGTN